MNQVSANPFHKAAKTQARLRMAIYGASGSGKTYSALSIGSVFGTVALIDTERGSASKYADLFTFDVLELTDPHPAEYIKAIKAAGAAGYNVLIIDSLSHAWQKVLELVDDITRKSQSKNSYLSWRDVTPLQNQFVDAMLTAPMHIIATMRSKTEYALDKDDRGKLSPRKIGLAPIQRDGIEYEFDVAAEMNADNDFIVTKTRCPALQGKSVNKPGANVGNVLKAWLSDGAPMPPPLAEVKREPEATPATVRGAGVQPRPIPPPASPPEPTPSAGSSDDNPLFDDVEDAVVTAIRPDELEDPDLYHCARLKIHQTKTATQYILFVHKSATRITVNDLIAFEGLTLNGKSIIELPPGEYPLEPSWSVRADTNGRTWDVHSIEAEMAF